MTCSPDACGRRRVPAPVEPGDGRADVPGAPRARRGTPPRRSSAPARRRRPRRARQGRRGRPRGRQRCHRHRVAGAAGSAAAWISGAGAAPGPPRRRRGWPGRADALRVRRGESRSTAIVHMTPHENAIMHRPPMTRVLPGAAAGRRDGRRRRVRPATSRSTAGRSAPASSAPAASVPCPAAAPASRSAAAPASRSAAAPGSRSPAAPASRSLPRAFPRVASS